MNQTGDQLGNLRRVTYRLVGVDVETHDYVEGKDSAFILFTDDVEAFIRRTIRLHGRKNSSNPFLQQLVVEMPGIHYQPSFTPGDECAYIPLQCWANPRLDYNPEQIMGVVYRGSILQAYKLKRLELDAQKYGHPKSCSGSYGGSNCYCKLINIIPEWTEPYIDPHFKDLFDLDIEAERQRFNDKFKEGTSVFRYC